MDRHQFMSQTTCTIALACVLAGAALTSGCSGTTDQVFGFERPSVSLGFGTLRDRFSGVEQAEEPEATLNQFPPAPPPPAQKTAVTTQRPAATTARARATAAAQPMRPKPIAAAQPVAPKPPVVEAAPEQPAAAQPVPVAAPSTPPADTAPTAVSVAAPQAPAKPRSSKSAASLEVTGPSLGIRTPFKPSADGKPLVCENTSQVGGRVKVSCD